GDSVRPEAKSVVSALKEKGISISMLSGDHAMNAGAIAAEVGIEDWLAGLLPEQKAEIISRVKCSAMVGDGANDALSFQAADVGIAVQGAVEVSLKNCDLVITKPGLAGLLEARELAERAMKVVRTNFGVTLTYNLLAGTLAACGFMQPLWAAIIMPLSALSVFTLTQWRMRVGQQ
ncbi:MAG: HAD-IC family P-type ATPase, partial [Bdellovibrionota bacterium]